MTPEPSQEPLPELGGFSREVRDVADEDQASVIALIQQVVRMPTSGGVDSCRPVMEFVSRWLADHGLPSRQLHDSDTGYAVGLVCDIAGRHPGPRYVLNACLDTAPFGDPASWQYPPTSGMIESGWLHGRGSADSKAAVAIFMHIAVRLRDAASKMRGSLTLLFDADEHTGNFGGAKRYFGAPDSPDDIQGVMIGYPGTDQIVIGGRGFLRAELTTRGKAGHTGSRRTADVNAVEKAAELVQILSDHRTPEPTDPALGLPPKITVTKITGGESYSIVPDKCAIDVDLRLTTTFDEAAGRKLIEDVAAQVDQRSFASTPPTTVVFRESWPAYRLHENATVRVALTRAAGHHLDKRVPTKVAGPSNIGNYLAKIGIDATAGLGVRYEGLHGANERIELATIPLIQATYHEAALRLLEAYAKPGDEFRDHVADLR